MRVDGEKVDEQSCSSGCYVQSFGRAKEEHRLRQSRTLDAIYVVDNASTDGTDFYLTELAKEQAQVIPCRLDRNVGGAGGFSYGLERAALDGFNWIWLMDDDGRPLSEQTLEALLNVAEKESNYSIVNCNVLCDGSALSFNIGTPYLTLEEQRKNIPSGLIENSACVFNGSLVGREVYEKLGTIRKEYFIRGDEVEFLMRCKNNGVKILTVVESLYYHPRSEYVRLSFFGKKFDYERMPLWKQFFLVRNYVATYCTTANEKQKRTIKRGLELILLGVILHERSLRVD